MTTSFEVPSGATLPNTYAPRVFTTSGDVVFVSALLFDKNYPGRVADEFIVYRNGAFQGRFARDSKRVGNTFTVVRDGGWSQDLALYVEPIVIPSSPGFGLLYEQDFSVLPNQTLAPGANVIGGQRWWFKGAFTETNETWKIVNGVGMRSEQRTLSAFDYAGGNLPACMMLDCADLARYNPDAPLLVQYRFQEVDLTYPSNVMPVCTLVTAAGSSAAVLHAERTGVNGCMYDKNGGQWRGLFSYQGVAGSTFVISPIISGAANLAVFQLASTVMLRRHLASVHTMASATVWPDVDAVQNAAHLAGLPLGSDTTPSQGFAFWGKNTVGPAFGLMRHSLRGLRVFQTGA